MKSSGGAHAPTALQMEKARLAKKPAKKRA
jgi:hypothetical protein